jgi:Tfp pilus assembly protein PilV
MINLLRHFRAANLPGRPPRTAAGPRASLSQLATRDSQRTPRRGISLLEVLISMFVLLFGLMGVAAIFPVGNHYAGKGEQFDRGSALAEAAFADLKARGMLTPEYWYYPTKPDGFTGGANVFNFIQSSLYTDPNPEFF